MIIVESFGIGLKPIVVFQPSARPIQTLYTVQSFVEIEKAALGNGFTQIGLHL